MTWQKATARRMGSESPDRSSARPFFREGLPTADDAGGVVDVELVAIVLEEV